MRSPMSPVSAAYAWLCLSLTIQVEYSFCRMRLPITGLTLPWQLVAAQDPGPIYFTGSPLESGSSAAALAEFAGWARTLSPEANRTAKTGGRESATQSVARGQHDLAARLNEELKRYEAGLPLHQ